ncbi:MAG: hypothetical protein P8Z31_12790 [Gammaproteobacteria bacterium]
MLRSLEQILIGGVIIAGAVYLLYGAWLYVNQQRLLYYPDFALRRDDLPTEEFAIDGETIRVHALNTEMPRAVLYFGGNAEAVGYQAEALTRALPARALYLVNYRGYGGSTGQPREQALYKDAVFIFDALEERHDTIAVIGRSLGSGVATWLAARRPDRGGRRDRAALLLAQAGAGLRQRHGHQPRHSTCQAQQHLGKA